MTKTKETTSTAAKSGVYELLLPYGIGYGIGGVYTTLEELKTHRAYGIGGSKIVFIPDASVTDLAETVLANEDTQSPDAQDDTAPDQDAE